MVYYWKTLRSPFLTDQLYNNIGTTSFRERLENVTGIFSFQINEFNRLIPRQVSLPNKAQLRFDLVLISKLVVQPDGWQKRSKERRVEFNSSPFWEGNVPVTGSNDVLRDVVCFK